ncbi:MAG: hypothetical protein MJ252_07325 [archaeon]|nr:hypothetical protein [archaeon]
MSNNQNNRRNIALNSNLHRISAELANRNIELREGVPALLGELDYDLGQLISDQRRNINPTRHTLERMRSRIRRFTDEQYRRNRRALRSLNHSNDIPRNQNEVNNGNQNNNINEEVNNAEEANQILYPNSDDNMEEEELNENNNHSENNQPQNKSVPDIKIKMEKGAEDNIKIKKEDLDDVKNEQRKRNNREITKFLKAKNKFVVVDIGIDSIPLDFIDEKFKAQAKDFSCSICHNFPNPHTALEVKCCGKIFCMKCLKKSLIENFYCPICKSVPNDKENEGIKKDEGESPERNFNLKDKVKIFKDDNKILYRELIQFEIKCPKKCDWTGTIKDYENHCLSCPKKTGECCFKHIGCCYQTNTEGLTDHEKNCDKQHLKLALNYLGMNKTKGSPLIGVVKTHQHALILEKGKNWRCAGKKSFCASRYLSQRHHSSVSGDIFKEGMRFACNKCKFYLCMDCFDYFTDHMQ